MSRTMDWRGTWLQAVWLVVPRRLGRWNSIVERWSRSALLDHGSAIFIDRDPSAMDFDSVQDPNYLPELRWSGTRSVLIEELQRRTPHRLELEIPEGTIAALRLSFIVNPDHSLSIIVGAPLSLFEEDILAGDRFRRFVEMCTELFAPDAMLAGTIGGEAQIHGVKPLIAQVERWTGRAFYGQDLLSKMPPAQLDMVRPEVRLEMEGGGLFVSWGAWPLWREAPPSWQEAVVAAIGAELGVE